VSAAGKKIINGGTEETIGGKLNTIGKIGKEKYNSESWLNEN
jgi:hypothetical protein